MADKKLLLQDFTPENAKYEVKKFHLTAQQNSGHFQTQESNWEASEWERR